MMPCNHGARGSVDELCVLCVPAHILIERLRERVKMLEGDLASAIVRERQAEERAAAADVIVLPVEGDGALPGEIDLFSDGHSHHYVPSSTIPQRVAEAMARAAKEAADKLTVVPLETVLEHLTGG
jgi:hypothetical protein